MKRIYLTPEFIDGARAPETGEIWLADTIVPGFGVRIWHNNRSNGRAYCVRVAGPDGRFVRRTLNRWDLLTLQRSNCDFLFREPSTISFGDLLGTARKWARNEIDRISGHPTLEEEERLQRERSSKQAQTITLTRSAKAVITNLEIAGRSQSYRDRLDKLFSTYVPVIVQNKTVSSLTLSDLTKILTNPTLSNGNMRALRPFLGKCIQICRKFHCKIHDSLWDFERNLDIDGQKITHPMAKWKVRQFRDLVQHLSGHEKWQQGLCLAFYLETQGSLQTTMSARWDEFIDVSYFLTSDPERKRFWRREWRANGRQGWRAQITIGANRLFERIAKRPAHLDAEEIFLFPSQYGRQVQHIRSVEHVWRHALSHYRLPYLTPRLAHIFYDAARWTGPDRTSDRLYNPENAENMAQMSNLHTDDRISPPVDGL